MVRVRIAPSPTGDDFHIGNAYTALINYAFAKKHHGVFLVRIEDTDRTRYVPGAEEKILSSLSWLGLDYTEGPDKEGLFAPYRQSERLPVYKRHARELVVNDHAYYCFCTQETLGTMREEQKQKGLMPKYDRRCLQLSKEEIAQRLEKNEPYVIRMKIPEGETVFDDIVRGKITIKNAQLDDQVLIKSDGFPTYHLAVVVDDHLMQISHVIRGEDWISSTPKHILLYQFFGWELPLFAHLPLLRNPDKSKLSKRKNPVWVSWYREQGFLPEAVVNYLSLMGWSHPEGKELFTIEEFIEKFTLERVQTVSPIFDINKLRWLNQQKLMVLTADQYGKLIQEQSKYHPTLESLKPIIPLVQSRLKTIKEYDELAGFFYEQPSSYDTPLIKDQVETLEQILSNIPWTKETIEEAVRKAAEEKGYKVRDIFMQLRHAITGKTVGPPLTESMEILGKEESLERIRRALK